MRECIAAVLLRGIERRNNCRGIDLIGAIGLPRVKHQSGRGNKADIHKGTGHILLRNRESAVLVLILRERIIISCQRYLAVASGRVAGGTADIEYLLAFAVERFTGFFGKAVFDAVEKLFQCQIAQNDQLKDQTFAAFRINELYADQQLIILHIITTLLRSLANRQREQQVFVPHRETRFQAGSEYKYKDDVVTANLKCAATTVIMRQISLFAAARISDTAPEKSGISGIAG